MNNGINLATNRRSVKSISVVKDRLRVLRISSMAMLFFVGAGSVLISILIVFSPLPQLRKDEAKVRNELAVFQPDIYKLAFINNRGDSIKKIISKRSLYDRKLEVIGSKLPADVSLDSLSIDKKNYTLKFSSKNLDSIDSLLNSLVAVTGKGKDFLGIYLTSISTDEVSQKFILVVDLITT